MTNTTQNRERAWYALRKCITDVAEPWQVQTVGFPANRVPSEPVFADMEFTGEYEKGMTLGNVMVEVGVTVRILARHPETAEAAERFELDLWHMTRNVQAQIKANFTLDGNVSGVFIGLATVADIEVGVDGVPLRAAEFPVRLQELEAEVITR